MNEREFKSDQDELPLPVWLKHDIEHRLPGLSPVS
jgi:hypothetical protein